MHLYHPSLRHHHHPTRMVHNRIHLLNNLQVYLGMNHCRQKQNHCRHHYLHHNLCNHQNPDHY